MSFPKARILRFNEVSTCAPPPGKYDPKYDNKVKGAVIEKSKRFVEGKVEGAPSIASQDSASSCSHNYNPIVTFRTPQLPKKKIVSTPRSAVERPISRIQREPPTPESKTRKRLDYETEKNLIEQINELTRVHSIQLVEKDHELATLHSELASLKAELLKAENCHIVDYNTMKQQYEKEMKTMKEELEVASQEAEMKMNESNHIITELQTKLSSMEENVKNLSLISSDLEYQLLEANVNTSELKREFAEVEKQLETARDRINELITVKKEDMEMMAENSLQLEEALSVVEASLEERGVRMMEKLSTFERDLESERMNMTKDVYSFLDSIAEDAREKIQHYEITSAFLQATIASMGQDLDRKINEMVSLISNSSEIEALKLEENLKLTEELEKSRAGSLEKDITIADLQHRIEDLQHDLSHLTKQCRKFELVQNQATKTIDVLSQRLFESESEVERMNDQTEELTLRKNALEDKVKSVINENKYLLNTISELQISLVKNVKEVENVLLAKVETYRRAAVSETEKLKFELGERQKTIELLMTEVDSARTRAIEADEYITLCQGRIEKCKQEMRDYSKKMVSLEGELEDKLAAQRVLVVEATAKVEESEAKIVTLNAELSALKTKVAADESKRADLLQKLETAQSTADELNMEIETKNNTIDDITLKCQHLEIECAESERSIEELSAQLKDSEESGLVQSRQLAEATRTVNELTENVQEMTESVIERDLKLEAIQLEREELCQHNKDLTTRVATLVDDLQTKESLCKGQSEELEMQKKNLALVAAQYETVEKEYYQMCTKVGEVERENMKYIGELVSDLMVEKQRCEELTHTADERASEMKRLEGELSRLRGELAAVTEGREALSEQLNNTLEEKSTLEHRILELEGRLKATDNERSGLVKEKEDLVEIVRRQWDEREFMTNQIESQQEEILELKQLRDDKFEEEKAIYQAELQNEIFALQQNLEETQKHAIDLQNRNDELVFKLNSADAELTAAEVEKERLDDSLKDLIEKLSSTETRVAAMEKRKGEYKMYAVELEHARAGLLKQLEESAEEREKLLDDKEEMSMQLTSQTARLADLDCRSREMETRCGELETRIEELTAKNEELESIVGPYKEQLVEFERERLELQLQSESAKKELKALALDHAKVLGHHNHKQKILHIVQLTETLHSLKKENEKLLNQNNKLRASILAQQQATIKRPNKPKKEEENKENVDAVVKAENLRVKTPEPTIQRNGNLPGGLNASPLSIRNSQQSPHLN